MMQIRDDVVKKITKAKEKAKKPLMVERGEKKKLDNKMVEKEKWTIIFHA